jgi:amino acid transporter
MYIRFGIFFIGGALCVGIVCAYNDPTLVSILTGTAGGSGTAAASPYVIAMTNLKVEGLPHLVNALMITSIFSAGNTYTYCATRNLYGLALEGRAPALLRKCTKGGVPIYCFFVVMCFPFLSFLQLSNGSNTVLTWLVSEISFPLLCLVRFLSLCGLLSQSPKIKVAWITELLCYNFKTAANMTAGQSHYGRRCH